MTGQTGVELHVADVERSLAFYEALGFTIERRWEDWIRLDRDGMLRQVVAPRIQRPRGDAESKMTCPSGAMGGKAVAQ